MCTVSRTLSEWAAGLTYDHLDDAAIDAAKRFLYDSIGCALGGFVQDDCRIMGEYLADVGGQPHCTCIGTGHRASVTDAALFNALAIRAMDYNDIYWKSDPCHPSDVISAATSISEWRRLCGSELLVGIIIAYELQMRFAESGQPGIREKGWHHATLTAFTAPAVAGRMLGLDAEQIQHAIGISASHCCTLGAVTAGKLTKMKNTVDPMATQAGVRAALLAQKGYTGPEHVIEGKEGLVHCMGPDWDLSRLTDGLGSPPYRILQCGMKAAPIEALTHSPLSALMKIIKQHAVQPDDVAEIIVETIARAADILSDPAKYRPTSKETADHSMPYCLAVAVADKMVTPRQFTPQRIADPALHRLMDTIKAVGNDEFEALFPEKQPARVTLKTTSGAEYSARVDVPKGDYRDPMTVEEIEVKFTALAGDRFGRAQCDRLRDTIMDIENVADTGELMRLTVPA